MSLLKSKKKVKKAKSSKPAAEKTDAAPADGAKAEKKPVPKKPKSKKDKKGKKAATKVKGEKKSRKPRGNNKMSAIAAAAVVFEKNGNKPLSALQLIEAMTKKGLWKTPGGKTPDRTLNSALLREIAENGKKSRFVKADRGLYQLRG